MRGAVGVAIPGRVLAYYFAFNMGGNGLALSPLVFVQTVDGYRFRIELNDMDPFGFIFFSNNAGFIACAGLPQTFGDNTSS